MEKRLSRVLWVSMLCFLLVSAIATQAFAEVLDDIISRGVVRVGIYTQDPPKQFNDPKTGQLIGLEPDIAAEFAQALGVKLELVPSEWDALIPGLLSGKFDIIIANMARLPKRALVVDFTLAFENLDWSAVLVRSTETRIKKVEDLNKAGIKIGVNRGSAAHMCAEKNAPKATITAFANAQLAAMALQAGQLDAVVEDVTTMALYAKEHKQVKLTATDQILCGIRTGFAIKPGNFRLWNFSNMFLVTLKDSGKYAELYEKWFPGSKSIKACFDLPE